MRNNRPKVDARYGEVSSSLVGHVVNGSTVTPKCNSESAAATAGIITNSIGDASKICSPGLD